MNKYNMVWLHYNFFTVLFLFVFILHIFLGDLENGYSRIVYTVSTISYCIFMIHSLSIIYCIRNNVFEGMKLFNFFVIINVINGIIFIHGFTTSLLLYYSPDIYLVYLNQILLVILSISCHQAVIIAIVNSGLTQICQDQDSNV